MASRGLGNFSLSSAARVAAPGAQNVRRDFEPRSLCAARFGIYWGIRVFSLARRLRWQLEPGEHPKGKRQRDVTINHI